MRPRVLMTTMPSTAESTMAERIAASYTAKSLSQSVVAHGLLVRSPLQGGRHDSYQEHPRRHRFQRGRGFGAGVRPYDVAPLRRDPSRPARERRHAGAAFGARR